MKISVSDLGWSEALKEAIRRRGERPDGPAVVFINPEETEEENTDNDNSK